MPLPGTRPANRVSAPKTALPHPIPSKPPQFRPHTHLAPSHPYPKGSFNPSPTRRRLAKQPQPARPQKFAKISPRFHPNSPNLSSSLVQARNPPIQPLPQTPVGAGLVPALAPPSRRGLTHFSPRACPRSPRPRAAPRHSLLSTPSSPSVFPAPLRVLRGQKT